MSVIASTSGPTRTDKLVGSTLGTSLRRRLVCATPGRRLVVSRASLLADALWDASRLAVRAMVYCLLDPGGAFERVSAVTFNKGDSQSSPSSTPAFSSSRPGADDIPPTRRDPFRGLVPRQRPRLRARFLRWAHCRRPLRVVATVTCGASLWLPASFYDEALHAGPTEPALRPSAIPFWFGTR